MRLFRQLPTHYVEMLMLMMMMMMMTSMCVCVHSDVLCGSLFCDVSAISNPQIVNYLRGRVGYWTITSYGIAYTCRYAYYRTVHNGPDRTDPGFVPNGASCGTEKVAVFDKLIKKLHF